MFGSMIGDRRLCPTDVQYQQTPAPVSGPIFSFISGFLFAVTTDYVIHIPHTKPDN